MSDQEDNICLDEKQSVKEVTEPDFGEGACGGRGLRPSSPRSEGDNFSMDVQFGEGSSRHASEISSLSYQNLLDDNDIPGPVLSRRESEESVDSYLPDIPDDIPQNMEGPDMSISVSQRVTKSGENIPNKISIKMTDDNIQICEEIYSTDRLGGRTIRSESKRNESMREANEYKIACDLETKDIQYSFRKQDFLDTQIDGLGHRSRSLPPTEEKKEDTSWKRNSLEIRNNIPVIGEIKNYEKDINSLVFSSQGAKPKIKKQSPGLACRVGEGSGSGSDREGSSSEKEMANDMTPAVNVNRQNGHSSKDSFGRDDIDIPKMTIPGTVNIGGVNVSVAPAKMDVQNEYDYVKYSRVQQGSSYVGMRLAYSSSNDAANLKSGCSSVNGIDHLGDSSREGTPERFSQQKMSNARNIQERVSEETLMEIPLNGPDTCLMDGSKPFSLSPENTECDSIEVESVVSEDDKSPVGMPNVEDGLSSSQASDAEDNPFPQEPVTPTKMLQMKQKAEIQLSLNNQQNVSENKPVEIDAEAIIEDLKAKREFLDHAINDIREAIQKSKGTELKTSYAEESDNTTEPIWVKRETEMEDQKPAPSEEIRLLREEFRRKQGLEMHHKEQEHVYEMENENDRLLENQFTRNDGKVYQAPKGYDSDDEYEDGVEMQYTRRNKGKKYSSISGKEDSIDHVEHHSYVVGPISSGSLHNSDSVSMYGDNNSYAYTQESQHNSESQCSSEEYGGSDTEHATKTAYIKKEGDYDTDEETDQLLKKQYQGNQHVDIPELSQPPVNRSAQAEKRRSRAKEGEQESSSVYDPDNPAVLIEGVLFRARYLGSTQLISEGQPSKAMRMMQAQEAVGRIKAPEGENQPSTEVDLFVSTEKIMVLNTDLQEIMMDHSLRTVSYIADIGDILVIMARRRLIGSPGSSDSIMHRKQAKILCHVFESEEAQLIAQSIGQAFQVAYMEFLKANGIEDPGLMKEIDYQDVLNQQEIYGEELNLFANKDMHKEVIVPKVKGENLGIVIVESGWGSMVPTVVVANMAPAGPAARCGQLNIGDQIISINGISLVGLPLSTCQNYIKNVKHQTVVKLTVVPCPPVVEVLIKRPDVKYQLGFSVQNGVICSLLRGGIAERGGVRVGHRIIEINNQSVVAVPHEKIVALLANSVGEIHMKTMPTSIFRLLTGQETPHFL
ncbi:hypothetical protein ACJMK2_043843 [Sinanodonta woodiana]|uniref:Uncharacterized protein n=1 Tax=Sinanodonta woodiana TaxID=1069815 RepID=A0ABD3VZW4_SINWO